MKDVIFIGIDDTDIIGSEGTGRMARNLTDYLVELGMGSSLGVTRHQLLVDDRIPYTSHNSSLCIGIRTEKPASMFSQPSIEFLKNNFREGSDPGLCICCPDTLSEEIIDFGLRAQDSILNKQEAIDIAERNSLFLIELGGTGGGIIGALAAVALRTEGNSGRFVDLPGIRDIEGKVIVKELLARTEIVSVQNSRGEILGEEIMIDSRDWIRPSLVEGKPVLRVRPLAEDGNNVWTSVEIRERDKIKEKK
jgi:hypothetical protein